VIQYPIRKPDYVSVRFINVFSRFPVGKQRNDAIMDQLTRVEGMTPTQARKRFGEIKKGAKVSRMPLGGKLLTPLMWAYKVDPQTLRDVLK
jgi:hypothetical protein